MYNEKSLVDTSEGFRDISELKFDPPEFRIDRPSNPEAVKSNEIPLSSLVGSIRINTSD